jgi:protein-disulfide isomerase
MLLLSMSFIAVAGVSSYQERQVEALAAKKLELSVAPQQVIGSHPDFKGDPHSPYTLVEFGDYQCPPCRAVNAQLQDTLRLYNGRVKFVFRNLPLASIHPYAMSAALAAEAARKQAKFWQVHDALYSADLDDAGVAQVLSSQEIRLSPAQRQAAKEVVEDDLKQAKSLGLNSTPTFLLCRPDGKVLILPSLSSLDSIVE